MIKMDGDVCGGVVFLVCLVMGKLIYFVGVSEKFSGLELFYFDWVVGCIFGMGDVLGLIECVQVVDFKVMEVKKFGDFDFEDLLL